MQHFLFPSQWNKIFPQLEQLLSFCSIKEKTCSTKKKNVPVAAEEKS
jgi:hypothetical protein